MLCPEVWNFPPPKTVSATTKNVNLDYADKTINMNNFYQSLVITCPDELQTPSFIEEIVSEDNDYYNITDCPLGVLLDITFVENFVQNGKLFCLSVNRDCLVQNCAAITPDGTLTLHILNYIYQTLGLEGTKQKHNYYEIKIDLTNIKLLEKLKQPLQKLETFDFNITWEPHNENICPSSLAKYLYDQNINISVKAPSIQNLSPSITEIPSLNEVDTEELAEWIGMLVLKADMTPTYNYVSTYSAPESDVPLQSSRISLLITKGFFTPHIIHKLMNKLSGYTSSRDLNNYWTSVSVQSYTDCPWRWNYSSQCVFQAHNSSTSIFFSNNNCTVYSIGQIKFS